MIESTHLSIDATAAEVAYRHHLPADRDLRYVVRPRPWTAVLRRRHGSR